MELRVLTTGEVADLLGVSARQVTVYCHKHALPVERTVPRIGRHGLALYMRADVLRWMRTTWPTIRRGRPKKG